MKTFTKSLFVILLIGLSVELMGQNYYSARGRPDRHSYRAGRVDRVLYHHPGYEWVGTTQIHKRRGVVVLVTLRKGHRYVEISMNSHGKVLGKRYYKLERHPRNHRYNGYVYRGWQGRYSYPITTSRYRRPPMKIEDHSNEKNKQRRYRH